MADSKDLLKYQAIDDAGAESQSPAAQRIANALAKMFQGQGTMDSGDACPTCGQPKASPEPNAVDGQ